MGASGTLGPFVRVLASLLVPRVLPTPPVVCYYYPNSPQPHSQAPDSPIFSYPCLVHILARHEYPMSVQFCINSLDPYTMYLMQFIKSTTNTYQPI